MERVVICGASGLLGTRLFEQLLHRGSAVVVVGRKPDKLHKKFPTAADWWSWDDLASNGAPSCSAIVNLAGAGVMERRWNDDYKRLMTESRIKSTGICAKLAAERPELRLINASSVHAYGIYYTDHDPFAEGDEPRGDGRDFYLYELIRAWEAATLPATEAGASVALLRLGVVLDSGGGALDSLVPLFRFFLGGRQGSGRQIMPWISLDDVVSGILFLLDNPNLSGPVNFAAPGATTNAEVMRSLGKALRRPSWLPMPAFLVRLLLGQGGEELILGGQRVEPQLLIRHGFEFRDAEIESCLERLFNYKSEPQ